MIQDKKGYSTSDISLLTKLFVERSGRLETPSLTMRSLVQELRTRSGIDGPMKHLESLLALRNIVEFDARNDMECDGRLEPKSSVFAGGFRMSIRRDMSNERIRFTIAHELCHTFFYELVPEIKFVPHQIDKQEERLCNFGAAELLVPTHSIMVSASGLPVSMKALKLLASTYGVSVEAMFSRLQFLNLWKCQMSVWYKMTNGKILLDRLYGRKWLNWHWEDESVITGALVGDRNAIFSGRTFIGFKDESGHNRVAPVYYQLKKSGDTILALWSRRAFAADTRPASLFEAPRARRTGSFSKKYRDFLA